MKIKLAQINTQINNLQANSLKIIDIIQNSTSDELIVFPELALSGYSPQDLLLTPEFIIQQEIYLNNIIQETNNKSILLGSVYQEPETQKLYNSAYYIKNQKVQKVIHKKFLPNSEIFYEYRYFTAGELSNIQDFSIEFNNKTVGVFVCEDLINWSEHGNKFLESLNINKLDYAVCLSASPYRQQHIEFRTNAIKQASQELNCPAVLVNTIGAHDGIVFDGSSCVVNKTNIISLKSFNEDIQTFGLNSLNNSKTNNSSNIQELSQALVLGIKDYFAKTGFTKTYIGLSGGIDSALVSTLAVKALGAENVYGILMPSEYSSQGSINDSLELANNLKIQTEIINIQEIFELYKKTLSLGNTGIETENLQARIRGMLLMARANENNSLVLVTSNKSEISVGYSTMYGDTCGALAPIGDLWKTQVWELSRTFPEIPEIIINKAPSAELRPDQKDSDSLPDYGLLDSILIDIIENKLTQQEIYKKYPESHGDIERIFTLIKRSEFKRQQFAPILKVSYQSYGDDWRQVITAK